MAICHTMITKNSSRMRAARSLTDRISWYQAGGACLACTPPGYAHPPGHAHSLGMHAPTGIHPPGHACPPATHASPSHAHPWPCMPPSYACPWPCTSPQPRMPSLWTEFLTHASENITLPQTSFAGAKKMVTAKPSCHYGRFSAVLKPLPYELRDVQTL